MGFFPACDVHSFSCFQIKSPRLLQSIFSSIGDLYAYKLSYILFNKHVARWAVSFQNSFFFYSAVLVFQSTLISHDSLFQIFSQLTCWFMFFCITRTLSNSLETVLSTVSLFYWLSSGWRRVSLFIAALTCILRPTSAITWIYLGIWEFIMAKDRFKFLFLEVIPIG